MKKYNAILTTVLVFTSVMASAAEVPVPVATDSRIKTFVYSENDVFNLVAHYGYQSNIEFPANETIETISIGNKVGWQVVTAGRRLFIRPTLSSARTNMTVITSKRAYQFDITAVPAVYSPEEELAYVVRFYYPDDKKNRVQPAPYSDDALSQNAVYANPSAPIAASGGIDGENYNYTYTGDEGVAPQKVYDDGKSTYFRLPATVTSPSFAIVNADKSETPVKAYQKGEYWVLEGVASQFMVRQGDAWVCVYNERVR